MTTADRVALNKRQRLALEALLGSPTFAKSAAAAELLTAEGWLLGAGTNGRRWSSGELVLLELGDAIATLTGGPPAVRMLMALDLDHALIAAGALLVLLLGEAPA